MSKDFAMLVATRKLENYLSREYYKLDKMKENERVTDSLMETKTMQYNELVDTLNNLFSALTGTADPLFKRYVSEGDADLESEDRSGFSDVSDDEPVPMFIPVATEVVPEPESAHVSEPADEPEPTPEQEPWQLEGYVSYDAWLADKSAESAELPDDLSIGVNVSLSQHRAGQVLDEYKETSGHDIAAYVPEDDTPVEVLPQEMGERPTENLDYLHHTVDNIRVDNDPTQIAAVETAVERDAEGARRGTDIDVNKFMYRPQDSSFSNLLDEDILKLQVRKEAEAIVEDHAEEAVASQIASESPSNEPDEDFILPDEDPEDDAESVGSGDDYIVQEYPEDEDHEEPETNIDMDERDML